MILLARKLSLLRKRDWKDYAKAGLVGAGLAAGSVGAYKLYQNLKNGQQPQNPPPSPATADDEEPKPKGR